MAKSANGWARKKPNTAATNRKYNSPEHRGARKYWTPIVAAGQARCWRPDCRTTLTPGRWHVGHNDAGTQIMGPECTPCNLRHAARKGARIANAKRKAQRASTQFIRPTR